MEKLKSLQGIIQHRQQSEFVGREEQVEIFRENLTLPFDDERRLFLFNVWGQGGVGKTYLIRHFKKLVEKIDELGAVTVYTDEDEKDVPSMMDRIVQQFQQHSQAFKEFSERYKVYRQKKQELETDPDFPKGFPNFVGQILTEGACQLADQVPGLSIVTQTIDKDTIATQTGDWVSYVARRINNKDEIKLMLCPVKVLTPLFLKGLNQLAKNHLIGLFFDAYEQNGKFLDDWLRDILEGRYGEVSCNNVIVIAGRHELDKNQWSPYNAVLARLSLEPFTEDEVREYLTRKGITNQQVVNEILNLSGRLPLLVATLAEGNPDRPGIVGDPSDTAVGRFLKWVDNPQRKQVAINAALVRRLNRDVIAELVGEEDSDVLFAWLKKMPFVLERKEGWFYHEVVRLQMLRYKHRESEQNWAKLHGRLAEYYEICRNQLQLEEEVKHKDPTWQSHTLEILYHYLCQSPQKYLTIALNEFVSVPEHLKFAYRWAETIEQAGRDASIEEVRGWGTKLLEGLKAYDKGRYDATVKMFDALLDRAIVEPRRRAIALNSRAYTYYLLNQYSKAESDISEAIQLAPQEAHYWANRGAICFLMYRYEEALRDFNRAIEIDSKVASIFARRGETYRMMGHYDEALRDFDHAFELDSGDAWRFGRRGETHRMMGHYEAALRDFDCAIEMDCEEAWILALREITYCQMELQKERQETSAISIKSDDSKHYTDVIRLIALGQIVPFLGSDINLYDLSQHIDQKSWNLDSPDSLIGLPCELCPLEPVKTPLIPPSCPIISRIIPTQEPSKIIGKEVRYDFDKVLLNELSNRRLHLFLAQLPSVMHKRGYQSPYKLIVTTNFDDTLERAFKGARQPFDLVYYRDDYKRFVHRRFRLQKNCNENTSQKFKESDNVINDPQEYEELSLDNYPTILKLPPKLGDSSVSWIKERIEHLPTLLLAILENSSIWFLDYRLSDCYQLLLLRQIWSNELHRYSKSWAIHLYLSKSERLEQELWKREGVTLIYSSLEEYLTNLEEQIQNLPIV